MGRRGGLTNGTPQQLSDTSRSKSNEKAGGNKDKNKKLRRKMQDTNSPSMISHASKCEWRHRVVKSKVRSEVGALSAMADQCLCSS